MNKKLHKDMVISTIPESKYHKELLCELDDIQLLKCDQYEIHHCIGCTHCWMKTPGICSIKDDFEPILKTFIHAHTVILLTTTDKGFVSSSMKNIIDRLLPLVMPYTCIKKGSTRHKARYDKTWNVALLYTGEPGNEFLKEWFNRLIINFHFNSLGVYHIDQRKELYHELNHI